MTLVSRPVMMTLRQPRVTCPISFASCHIYTQYILSLMFLSLAISSVSVSGTYMTPSDCPIQTCLMTQFVPETDYFPIKLNVTMGNFAVDYYNNFKVLTNKYTGEQYVITLCGTQAPVNNSMVARTISGKLSKVQLNLAPTAKTFMGPITKIAIDETITANVLELLGARSLIAAMDVTYITSPCLHALYEMKMISNFPSNTTIRASIIPNMDIVLSGNYAHTQPKFLQASITAELSPIGRLEWVKYLGALLNREYAAQTLYDDILGRYNTLKNQAMAVATKSGTPIVAWINYLKAFPPWTTQDTWTIKNADYQLQYTRDAGATPFTTNTTTYYNPMDAAAALLGGNVDIIIDETYIGYYPNGYSDFLEKWTFNGTYTSKFLTNKQVWRNDRMHTETGGDDWFERAIIQIDAVLQDLISITQPSAVSTKQRVWFRNYAENEGYGQTLDRCLDVSAPLFPMLQTPVLKDPLCPNIPIETQAGYKPLPTPTPKNMNGVTTTTVQTGVVAVLMAIVAMVM